MECFEIRHTFISILIVKSIVAAIGEYKIKKCSKSCRTYIFCTYVFHFIVHKNISKKNNWKINPSSAIIWNNIFGIKHTNSLFSYTRPNFFFCYLMVLNVLIKFRIYLYSFYDWFFLWRLFKYIIEKIWNIRLFSKFECILAFFKN